MTLDVLYWAFCRIGRFVIGRFVPTPVLEISQSFKFTICARFIYIKSNYVFGNFFIFYYFRILLIDVRNRSELVDPGQIPGEHFCLKIDFFQMRFLSYK